ncbi:hypothetical protein LKMONMHP_1077 [Methylobacterium organophilum]|uniref:Uncharacterized protein n=1 Tax=Methylobacterium organophilum TaxID=410 RepID=A0ABQ4T4Q6_METOR|nr:hypothetical protein LKMONMHP_1077 [Methylobacterium organophilum]
MVIGFSAVRFFTVLTICLQDDDLSKHNQL